MPPTCPARRGTWRRAQRKGDNAMSPLHVPPDARHGALAVSGPSGPMLAFGVLLRHLSPRAGGPPSRGRPGRDLPRERPYAPGIALDPSRASAHPSRPTGRASPYLSRIRVCPFFRDNAYPLGRDTDNSPRACRGGAHLLSHRVTPLGSDVPGLDTRRFFICSCSHSRGKVSLTGQGFRGTPLELRARQAHIPSMA